MYPQGMLRVVGSLGVWLVVRVFGEGLGESLVKCWCIGGLVES